MLDVRPSPIAGKWYEGDPTLLARIVDDYLDEAQLPALAGEVMAVIAPHAGHIYSGAVVAPMHHPYLEPRLTTAHDAYATPLGKVTVDKEALQELDGLLKSEVGRG